MDTKSDTQAKSESPKPAPGPVMDVVAPAPPSDDKPHDPPKSEGATPTATVVEVAPKVDDAKTKPAKIAKQPSLKSDSNSSTLAVIATVIIVLGLAVLAVIAYLKSK